MRSPQLAGKLQGSRNPAILLLTLVLMTDFDSSVLIADTEQLFSQKLTRLMGLLRADNIGPLSSLFVSSQIRGDLSLIVRSLHVNVGRFDRTKRVLDNVEVDCAIQCYNLQASWRWICSTFRAALTICFASRVRAVVVMNLIPCAVA